MNKITLTEAVNLSILKWDWIIKNNGDDYIDNTDGTTTVSDAIPELKNLSHDCGLCEYANQRDPDFYAFSKSCKECPLYKNNACGKKNSDWIKWFGNIQTAAKIRNATNILNKIKSIKI